VNSLWAFHKHTNIQFIWIISDFDSVLDNKRLTFEVGDIDVAIIKGKDTSIFDAMNIGIHRAIGDYVWFMNSGDLATEKSLTLLEVINDCKDFYSFGVVNQFENLSYKRNSTKHSPCHQGFICRRSVLQINAFDTNFPLSADHRQMKSIIGTYNGEFIDNSIAIYDNNGITSLPRLARLHLTRNESVNFKIFFVVKALLIILIGKRAFIRFINEVVNRRVESFS
jgi:hypothetical protein